MTQPNYGEVCGVLGPYVRISPQYERPAKCNRIAGHEHLATFDAGTHAEYDGGNFHLLARWTVPEDVAPNKRRIDKRPGRGHGS